MSVGFVVRMLTTICCVFVVTLVAEQMVFTVDCDDARFVVFFVRTALNGRVALRVRPQRHTKDGWWR